MKFTTVTRLSTCAWMLACLSVAGCDSKRDEITPNAIVAPGPTEGYAQDNKENVDYDKPNPIGPGLRRLSLDSLKLPVRRSFDLSHVEVRHFAVALDRDPHRIFEFVRDEIAFEPYVGCLRGPRGTLLAMSGNSVDRAALLGSLLESSGQHIRYAHGSLKKEVAEKLVASIWAERPGATTAEADDPSSDSQLDKLIQSVKRDGTLLAENLARAGYPRKQGTTLSRDKLVTETVDHYWIEMLQGDKWVAMDPSFGTATPGVTYADKKSDTAALPAELFHRVELHVRVEEFARDKGSTREVVNYESTSADLAGIDVLLSHELAESDAGSQVRPVLLVKQEQVVGLPFWLAVPLGNAAGGLADALSGGGGLDESTPTATAEFVEMVFTSPDGRKESVTREIFDRVGKHRRAGRSAISVDSLGGYGEDSDVAEWLPGSLYDFFITTGAIHAAHLSGIPEESPQTAEETGAAGEDLRMIGITFAAVSDNLLNRVVDAAGRISRVYAVTPRVFVTELSAHGDQLRLGFDLRRDQSRVAVSGFEPARLFIAEVLRGVFEGALEREVVGFFIDGADGTSVANIARLSTSHVFELAQASNMSTVVASGSGSPLASDVPGNARARIDEALKTGHMIVAPKEPVEIAGAKRYAWWQIDLGSGETMAVTDEGLHSDTAEGVVVQMNNGSYVLRLQQGGRIFRATARTPQQAARLVRTATRNFAKLGIETQWRGVVELWLDILAL